MEEWHCSETALVDLVEKLAIAEMQVNNLDSKVDEVERTNYEARN